VNNLSWQKIVALGLFAALAACQRQGPTVADVPTPPNAPVTPVTPIAVAPRPSPTDLPEDPPSDGGGTPNPEAPVSGDPVARLEARVYFVECSGQLVSGDWSVVSVGCRIHLDVTPKDSRGRPTVAIGSPRWSYSNPGIISASSDFGDYTPTLTALAPGYLSIGCTLDGIESNPVNITLK
jgi:hypothetical protein